MAVNFMLIDTSVLSEARKQGSLNEDIVFFLKQIPPGALAVPHAAVFELQRGALHIAQIDAGRGRAYIRWLERLLRTDIWLPPVDVDVKRLLARMTLTPELASFWISKSDPPKMKFGCDPEIAATAIVHGLPIASTDVSDYLRIHRHFPLPGLYCPIAGIWHVAPPEDWHLVDGSAGSESDWHQVIGPIEFTRTDPTDEM